MDPGRRLLTPAEVAKIFSVQIRTVVGWARRYGEDVGAVRIERGRWRFWSDVIEQRSRGEHDG